MATIRTALRLFDGMTAPLHRIGAAADAVRARFEALQDASAHAVDVASINEGRSALAHISETFDRIESGIRSADAAQQDFNSSLRAGSSAADGLWGKIKGAAAALGGLAAFKQGADVSDTLASTTARLRIVAGEDHYEEFSRQVMGVAQRSRAGYFETADAAAKLALNAGGAFNHDNQQVLAFLEQVNKHFLIGGASAQEQKNAMIQLTQAMASGALRGEELNSILDAAPSIARAIEKYLGIAEGSIKEYAEKGATTAGVVKNALFAMSDEINEKAEGMPQTWAQVWERMKNGALSAFSPVLQKINVLANSERAQAVFAKVLDGIAGAARLAEMALDGLGRAADWVTANWETIEPIIWGVAGAVAAFRTATLLASAAQAAFNAVLSMSPITWAILGIFALIAVIVALMRHFDVFGAQSTSVFGTLCGVINVARMFFVNLSATVGNIALAVWDAMSACAWNIYAAFHNTIEGVKSWFYGLLSTALYVVSGICAALNALPFVELDYSGITAKADEYAAKSAAASGSKLEYRSIGGAWDEGLHTFDSGFQKGWAKDAFTTGAAWGDGAADKLSGLFDFADNDPLGAGAAGGTETGFAWDDLLQNTGDTAENTAAAADALDIAEEDLAYLRDIAEREAINRFTTAEIRVDQQNTNYIDQSADLDGIMDVWASAFAEKLELSGEGVYA